MEALEEVDSLEVQAVVVLHQQDKVDCLDKQHKDQEDKAVQVV